MEPNGIPARGAIVAGRYRVLDLIGSGGMGVVLSVERLLLGDQVAIKLMHPYLATDPVQIRRFVREGRALTHLRGANVVRVIDIDRLPSGVPFLVMERLVGRTLREAIQSEGAHPFGVAVDYVRQACAGLAEVHASGFVHRDVKPGNIFVVARHPRPLVKLLDFGLAKPLTPSTEANDLVTASGSTVGSPRYMSPEQVATPQDVDARTDLWSLGATLYELLAGRAAFDAPTMWLVIAAVTRGTYPSLRSVAPWVPSRIDGLIDRCLSRDRRDRPPDAAALATALDEVARDVGLVFKRSGAVPAVTDVDAYARF